MYPGRSLRYEPTEKIGSNARYKDLLAPIYRKGKLVYELPALEAIKQKVQEEISAFQPVVMRLANPHTYSVGNEKSLHELKTQLVLQARLKIQEKT